MNNKKSVAKAEKLQQKLDAGFVTAHFPDVAGIVISMMYNQKGITRSLHRVVNFFPGSSAFFRVDCLNKDCVDGGFDLTQVLTTMINNRRESAKGDIICEGDGVSAGHSAIDYEIAIQYA
jgi:hypothetical protein